MRTRTQQRRGKRAGSGSSLPLLDEIERSVENAARALIKDGKLSLTDLVKLRDIVREILAERPHEVVVRWVDPWETNGGDGEEGTTGSTGKETKGRALRDESKGGQESETGDETKPGGGGSTGE